MSHLTCRLVRHVRLRADHSILWGGDMVFTNHHKCARIFFVSDNQDKNISQTSRARDLFLIYVVYITNGRGCDKDIDIP